MTPARKRALQWFYDRGAVPAPLDRQKPEWLTDRMFSQMLRAKQAHITGDGWCLTDKGRRELYEASQ